MISTKAHFITGLFGHKSTIHFLLEFTDSAHLILAKTLCVGQELVTIFIVSPRKELIACAVAESRFSVKIASLHFYLLI